jgi:AIPR protein.
MSIIHVRQIKAALLKSFDGLIDMSDWSKAPPDQREAAFLSRAVAAQALRQQSGLSEKDAASQVVDGGNDQGIDGLYFDQAEKILYFVNSKWMADGTGSPALADVLKLLAGIRLLVSGDLTAFNHRIRSQAVAIQQALDDTGTRFRIVLAYSGVDPLSPEPKRHLEGFLLEMNDTSDLISYDVLSQREIHEALSGAAEGRAINLEVALSEWGHVREPYEAYYGQVDLVDVGQWYKAHGSLLFAKNLRRFIGATDVNASIMEALKTEPANFWYLNNGITVLCSRIEKKPIGGAKHETGIFECEGVAVVNGAQTVGCVGEALGNGADVTKGRVSVRFISLASCPAGFATEVTRATNTQNRIERRDFAALDPQQERLRKELVLEGKQYAVKSGDVVADAAMGCTLEDATVALACANADPAIAVQAKREIGKLWESIDKEPYRLLFNSSTTGQELWRAVEIMRLVDAALRDEQIRATGKRRAVAVHGNRLALHEVFRRVGSSWRSSVETDFEKAKAGSEPSVGPIVTELAAAVESLYPSSYPASLFKNSTKCKALAKALEN